MRGQDNGSGRLGFFGVVPDGTTAEEALQLLVGVREMVSIEGFMHLMIWSETGKRLRDFLISFWRQFLTESLNFLFHQPRRVLFWGSMSRTDTFLLGTFRFHARKSSLPQSLKPKVCSS